MRNEVLSGKAMPVDEARVYVAMLASDYNIATLTQWKKFAASYDDLPDGLPIDLKEAYGRQFKSFSKFIHIDNSKAKTKVKVIKILIDGGRSNVKAVINGECVVIPSLVYKCDVDDVIANVKGSFVIDGQGYFVGEGAEFVESGYPYEPENESDIKVECFPFYVLAVLTHCPYLYQKTDCIEIELTCVAIAKQTEIESRVASIKSFEKAGRTYFINMKIVDRKPEGFGAGMYVNDLIQRKGLGIKHYFIVDIGGGTIGVTGYDSGSKAPMAGQPKIASSAGMQTLKYLLSDRFGSDILLEGGYSYEEIDCILQSATINPDGSYNAFPADLPDKNLGKALQAGLRIWATKNLAVSNAISRIAKLLQAGNYVYLTGGAFALPVFVHFFCSVRKFSPYKDRLVLLPSPEKLNLIGLDATLRKQLIVENTRLKLKALPPARAEVA